MGRTVADEFGHDMKAAHQMDGGGGRAPARRFLRAYFDDFSIMMQNLTRPTVPMEPTSPCAVVALMTASIVQRQVCIPAM